MFITTLLKGLEGRGTAEVQKGICAGKENKKGKMAAWADSFVFMHRARRVLQNAGHLIGHAGAIGR